MPDVCEKLEPAPIEHDACLIPRRSHCTGDISVHDLAYAGGELWVVATRFSCLATLDDEHSFVPRWRPKFISALAPEDRCHLNGLAVVGEQGQLRHRARRDATPPAAGAAEQGERRNR